MCSVKEVIAQKKGSIKEENNYSFYLTTNKRWYSKPKKSAWHIIDAQKVICDQQMVE